MIFTSRLCGHCPIMSSSCMCVCLEHIGKWGLGWIPLVTHGPWDQRQGPNNGPPGQLPRPPHPLPLGRRNSKQLSQKLCGRCEANPIPTLKSCSDQMDKEEEVRQRFGNLRSVVSPPKSHEPSQGDSGIGHDREDPNSPEYGLHQTDSDAVVEEEASMEVGEPDPGNSSSSPKRRWGLPLLYSRGAVLRNKTQIAMILTRLMIQTWMKKQKIGSWEYRMSLYPGNTPMIS